MKLGTIVSLQAMREIKKAREEDYAYQAKILGMTKLDLLNEMVRFQEERSRIGHLTLSLILRGKILFKALEQSAETRELKVLSRSYKRHLDHELQAYLNQNKVSSAEELLEAATNTAESLT